MGKIFPHDATALPPLMPPPSPWERLWSLGLFLLITCAALRLAIHAVLP